MERIAVKLSGQPVGRFPRGTAVAEVVKAEGGEVAGRALAAAVNGRRVDLSHRLIEDADLRILTFDDEEGRDIFRHSASHIMAQAVKRLFPAARLAIGPAIADGFYYDFDLGHTLTPDDLARVEAEMKKIVEEDLPFSRFELGKEEARALFRERGERYKLELIEELGDDQPISCYRQGEFVDLCVGPHVPSTGRIKSLKLLSVAGAYWRGDEKREMLQRIYGTAFESEEALVEHLRRLEEARRRDHRRLGVELDLFNVYDQAGAGLIYYHPHGATLRWLLEDFSRREHIKRGYQVVVTPHIARGELWERSGHYDYYRENMYFLTIDEQEYVLKPMNCPGHVLIYKSQMRSYRDLPIRYFELGTVYRYERSGVLHGLLRVRGFTQDDAHLFCRPDQLEQEITGVIHFALYMLRTLGFHEFDVFLSTRPEKYVGAEENWDRATKALKEALENNNLAYRVDPGEGVFYGPKIDIKLRDALGRAWQGPTIQLDFNLPERFDVTYVDSDGTRRQPAMIHRTLFGSMERFIGVLVEHYAGALPLWLAPLQVRVMPITDRNAGYAARLRDELATAGVRVEVDDRSEKIGYKIREAELQKVPYMLIVGDREAQAGAVAVRKRGEGDLGAQDFGEFSSRLLEDIRRKAIW